MNGWKVELRPSAKREFRQLEDGPRRDAEELIADLREQGPAIITAIELRGHPDTWRARFHDGYRMIYRVSRSRKHILVTRIRSRPLAYEGMKG